MPHVRIISASGSAQRKLVSDALRALASDGYEDVRRQDGGDWFELLSENLGGGLFDERSVIVVEEAEKLGELPEKCGPMLEAPGASTVILLICRPKGSRTAADGGDEGAPKGAFPVPKALLARCSMVKAPDVPPPWSRERNRMIEDAARAAGAQIAPDAVALLKELFDDIDEMTSETAKVAGACLLGGRERVTAADVMALCLADGARDLLKLLDGICAGRAFDSLGALASMKLSGGSELLPLLSAIHNRMRIAMYAACCGRDAAPFYRAIGARDYATRQGEAAAKEYGREALVRFVMSLFEMASNEKSGRGASWVDLEILLTELFASRLNRKG